MIVSGDGILAGNRLRSPVSLLDAAPTVCQLAGARELPFQDGVSLIPELERGEEREDRAVTAEWINLPYGRGTDYGRMIRQGKWKLISYVSHPEEELLICPDSDPWELYNRIAEFPELLTNFAKLPSITSAPAGSWKRRIFVRTDIRL